MKLWLKIAATAFLLGLFILQSTVCFAFIRSNESRHRFAALNLSRWSRFFLWWFGIRLEIQGEDRLLSDSRRFLIISNHLSYIDVLLISARFPSLFVTSVEIEESPGLGHICRAGGSHFVERRKRSQLRSELESLGKVLRDGVNLVIFPEGTTGKGDGVMAFKKSLFGTAVLAATPVLPICIRYMKVDGKPMSDALRDSVFYYGDMTFFGHFKKFVGLREMVVELEILDPLDVSSESCRKELAETAHREISSAFEPASLLGRTTLV